MHVCPYFAPSWEFGGTVRAVYELAKAQKNLNHEVSILTTTASYKSGRLKSKEIINNLNVYRFDNFSNYLATKFHLVTPLYNTCHLRDDFDIVHLHEYRSLLNFQVVKNIKSGKFFFTPWGTLPNHNKHSAIKYLLDKLYFEKYLKKINLTFAQTDHEMSVLSKYFSRKRIKLIPLGVSESRQQKASKKELRKQLKWPKNKKIILYLGRLSKLKGIDSLIKAMVSIEKARPGQFLLFLIGSDDGHLKELERLINNNHLENVVRVLAPIFSDRRFLAYQAADMFISLPTVYEETSTTCLEALQVGTPVITNNYAQIPFLKERDGLFYSSNRINDIVRQIFKVIDAKLTFNTKLVKEKFLWKSIAKQTIDSYVN